MWTPAPERYAAFCTNHAAAIPLFYQPWWLDAVCTQGRWIPFVRGDGEAVWPVFVKQKMLLRKVTMPPLTSRLGPWPVSGFYAPADIKDIRKQIGPVVGFVQHLAGTLPFYTFLTNNGFKTDEFHHYVIQSGSTEVELFEKMNVLSRRNIRKAAAALDCLPLTNMAILNDFISKSLLRHGTRNQIPLNLLENLYQALTVRKQGCAWVASDKKSRIHAAILLAWDSQTVYYLAGGLDERIPQIGASRYLLWKGMEFALQTGRSFDFGGGFIPGVDAVYESMGGEKKPYISATLSFFSIF